MAEDFLPLFETLWQDWLADSLTVSPFVQATFDMNAAPEPYVSFNAGRRPLIALTTNPGQTMPHQLRSHLQQENGLLNRTLSVDSLPSGRRWIYRSRISEVSRSWFAA